MFASKTPLSKFGGKCGCPASLRHILLVENQVIIEEDNFEEGLTPALIADNLGYNTNQLSQSAPTGLLCRFFANMVAIAYSCLFR